MLGSDLLIGIVFIGLSLIGLIWLFTGRSQKDYEYTEEFLEERAKYRESVVSRTMQFVLSYFVDNTEKQPVEALLSDDGLTIVHTVLEDGLCTISFNWESKLITTTIQIVEDKEKVKTYKFKLRAQKDGVYDYSKMADFLTSIERPQQEVVNDKNLILAGNKGELLDRVLTCGDILADKVGDDTKYLLFEFMEEALRKVYNDTTIDSDYVLQCIRVLGYLTKYYGSEFDEWLDKGTPDEVRQRIGATLIDAYKDLITRQQETKDDNK